jgi:hypothetical protein
VPAVCVGLAATPATLVCMSTSNVRQPVTLGIHDGKPVFEEAAGLHDAVMGLSVVGGFTSGDPQVIFEEHGTGQRCDYFAPHPDAILDESVGPRISRPDLRARLHDEDLRSRWVAIQALFMQEDPGYINQVVRDLRAEIVPDGGAATIISVSRRLQRRTGFIRMLHTAQAQPERPFASIVGGPHPLEHHAGGSHVFPSYLYVPLVLLTSPFTRGFVAARGIEEIGQTVLLVMMSPRDQGAVLRDAEVSWAQVYENALPDLRQLDGTGTTWLRQTNHALAKIDAQGLVAWWTDRLNALFTEATDLGRYRRPDGVLDAGNAYRELRSLDRILSNCVRIQLRPDDHASRVALAFEFFDLLPNIVDRGVSSAHVWNTMANPRSAQKILARAFALAPDPIGPILQNRADEVLSKIRAETLEHVLPVRRSKTEIVVGATGTRTLPEDVFIAQLFQQLRNTHHGYELDGPKKRELLGVHTGHISEAFPELVVLYVIALLSEPATALSNGWF